MATVTSTIQFKLNGVWTDISDVMSRTGITARRGIMGGNPYDRVASAGTLNFVLDNSSHNSGHLVGYYSLDHANKRAYITDSMPVRWKLVSSVGGGTTRYVYNGKVTEFEPEPGIVGSHQTKVIAEDFMSSLLDVRPSKIDVQLDQRTDQIVATVLTNAGLAPLNTDYDVTPDVFPYSLDGEDDFSTVIMSIFQKCAQSDASLIYIAGNTTDGETLVVRSRSVRAANIGVDATLSNIMTDISIKRSRETIFNDVTCSVARRKIDDTAVTIYSQAGELELQPAMPITFEARYSDPNSEAERISLYPGSEVTPVAGTDYRMSAISGGSAGDMNTDLGVTVVWGGNSASITLQNNGAVTGYVNLFKLRGKGMYLYSKYDANVKDTASITANGKRSLQLNLPYQTNINVAYDIANSILSRYKDSHTHIRGVEFIANSSDALMTAALTCDIGSRIYLSETVTGVAGYFFITSVEYTLNDGRVLHVSWSLVPANTTNVWVLGDSVLSVLGTTTIPNFYV